MSNPTAGPERIAAIRARLVHASEWSYSVRNVQDAEDIAYLLDALAAAQGAGTFDPLSKPKPIETPVERANRLIRDLLPAVSSREAAMERLYLVYPEKHVLEVVAAAIFVIRSGVPHE